MIYISRDNILNDSINKFNSLADISQITTISFENEDGEDNGGIFRDWISSVTKEIVNSGAFKVVPSGHYLTINNKYQNQKIYRFAGQIIATAINQGFNINIKLSLFVWKLLLSEKITIEDMNEYDHYLYQSLKWISENDVTKLDETFVNRNDEELKENGKNIKLTNDNKKEYIQLMLMNALIGSNEKSFKLMKQGFDETIIHETKYSASELRNKINGCESIDLVDWKKNTVCYDDDEIVDTFFDIISGWSDEKQRKLLKFVTGSSNVPINGFKQLKNLGGLFSIELSYDSSLLPEAHTCYNTINLPIDNDKDELERKLLIAIEVDVFGIE